MAARSSTKIRIAVCEEAIEPERLWRAIADPDCGAQLVFLGTTRRTTGSRITERLAYEAYRPMALGELQRLAEEAAELWPLEHLVIVHRLGEVAVGEASVAVAASSPHRPPVMHAVPWVMDELKRRVPIWKQEHAPDQTTHWVHPGQPVPEPERGPDVASVYVDHAATSWPKTAEVRRAITDALLHAGGAAGRGSHAGAQQASGIIAACRRQIAEVIGAPSPACIVLTANGTHALNLALHGLLAAGDKVVTTAIEHNSVLRPLHAIGCALDVVPCDSAGRCAPEEILGRVDARTRLVVISHASNVTGALQDVAAVAHPLRERGIPVLCDAAQSLGYVPIDVQRSGIALLAAPGHKGLGGPLGTGLLYVEPALHERIRPAMQGGTGTQSERLEMPAALPEKLEAGNLNTPALAGLQAGIAQLLQAGLAPTQAAAEALTTELVVQLRGLPGVQVIGHPAGAARVPVVSFLVEGWQPHDVAAVLDAEFGVRCRAGLHCAPLVHQYVGSAPAGTVRFSLGRQTTSDDLRRAVGALAHLVGEPEEG